MQAKFQTCQGRLACFSSRWIGRLQNRGSSPSHGENDLQMFDLSALHTRLSEGWVASNELALIVRCGRVTHTTRFSLCGDVSTHRQ